MAYESEADEILYGGEPGFEKTPRIWVDPDNPHIKSIYNSTPLATNAAQEVKRPNAIAAPQTSSSTSPIHNCEPTGG